jgi:divalent metal cation (Fe/Co/Zn/Cd) transporter
MRISVSIPCTYAAQKYMTFHLFLRETIGARGLRKLCDNIERHLKGLIPNIKVLIHLEP